MRLQRDGKPSPPARCARYGAPVCSRLCPLLVVTVVVLGAGLVCGQHPASEGRREAESFSLNSTLPLADEALHPDEQRSTEAASPSSRPIDSATSIDAASANAGSAEPVVEPEPKPPKYGRKWSREARQEMRARAAEMFYHGYNGYMTHAFPHDELRPLSCSGQDTWGTFALTLVDSLDMLALLGNVSEFRRAVRLTVRQVNFDQDRNVSVFETNIRVVGGLLSAHLQAEEILGPADYAGELLELALDAARRLLPAFDTPTGIPYGTVNFRHGVPPGETTITSLAGAGTHILEFALLSRLTGQPEFEITARTALRALFARRSTRNLVGNHIDVMSGTWTVLDAGIGSNADSFYEYLLKAYILLGEPEYLVMFDTLYEATQLRMKRGDLYHDVAMYTGATSLTWFTALSTFFPGLQVLAGDVAPAARSAAAFQAIWRQFGFAPEAVNLRTMRIVDGQEGYFLRPEMLESLFYLHAATNDSMFLSFAAEIASSIEATCRTSCGFAVVANVTSRELGDRMESFFLAETLKYLYLLFDDAHPIRKGNYVFQTEAHYFDMDRLRTILRTEPPALVVPPRACSQLGLSTKLQTYRTSMQQSHRLHGLPAQTLPFLVSLPLRETGELKHIDLRTACFKHRPDDSDWTFRLCFGRMVQMRRHDDAGQIMEEIALGFFHTRHFLQSAELQPLQIDFVASGFVTPLTTRCMDGDCLEQAFEGGAMYNATEGSRYSATVRFFCDNALDVLASKLEMALPDPPHFDFTVRSPLVCPFVMDASDAA
eukprot:m.166851 g.166851  ORF g.166851 m.166851 type:complete len:773 (-) comp10342_c0_seq1:128-2446(-)